MIKNIKIGQTSCAAMSPNHGGHLVLEGEGAWEGQAIKRIPFKGKSRGGID